ncbi:MAG: hypothetical protein DF168_01738 [Candidatus Moanabacter tarae]|uniref:Uncharacterized protein n=1 Tax=Candidatus Moanibacter tarae TaxID=2200854 RepID=A0A2Z4AJB5_9BACT|nr:MAG: hypothetical protein DF168_01738 [Candidatus Moanabacter tarae]
MHIWTLEMVLNVVRLIQESEENRSNRERNLIARLGYRGPGS